MTEDQEWFIRGIEIGLRSAQVVLDRKNAHEPEIDKLIQRCMDRLAENAKQKAATAQASAR